jgi:para-nitrobenzyl esterase
MWTWARLQAKSGQSRVFAYHFAHVPPYPQGSGFASLGAAHGAELRYVFGHLDQEPWAWTSFDRRLAETMAGYWTNFAKRGDPNGAGLPVWPSFTGGEERVLHLQDPIALGGVANRPALSVLDAIFAQARAARSVAAAR